MTHILVIDDDERLRELLRRYLTKQDYQVSTAPDAFSAKNLLKSLNFDLLVVDVMMPGEDGLSFVKHLRETLDVPVLMLTASAGLDTRVDGFEAGIDDFLSKPFEPRELVLRIEAILRRVRTNVNYSHSSVFGAYVFDRNKGRLIRDGETIELTRNERDILSLFVENLGEILSRESLLGSMAEETNERNVDVTITRLRKKIETDPKNPQYIHTARGQGYKFRPPS